MPLFEVLIPRDDANPLAVEFVREKFSWSAALLPPVWALWHGMGLEAFGWLVGAVLIVVAGLFIGGEAAIWLYLLFAAWIGFSASDLRLAARRRAGYADAGARIAADEFAAERDWLGERAQ